VRTINSILTNIRSYVVSTITPKGIEQLANIHPFDGTIQVGGNDTPKTYYKNIFEFVDALRKKD
jgi:hypothetical protein